MSAQKLVLFILAKLQDGTKVELHSPTFVIQGSRDNNREPVQLPTEAPQTAESSPSEKTQDPSPQIRTVETARKQTENPLPQITPIQKDPDGGCALEDIDFDRILPDFRRCRLVN
jgi:hypothetical protein